ncbi:MAG: hypothetical protein GY731_01410 [Gammaproteobacteria bacterium]|nr:hypothetical protein [Gammaproteobacteria bacterium]
MKTDWLKLGVACGLSMVLSCFSLAGTADEQAKPGMDYERARWHPSHFKPDIVSTTDEQCLACHKEVTERKPLAESPAGVKAAEALAWYQTLGTYTGEQDTFHRRHLESPLAKELMDLRCNFCHQGHDPHEEAPIPPTTDKAGFTLRKAVDVESVCLRCHGKYNYKVMGTPGPWIETGGAFQHNCLLCHAAIRTNRHQVTYLKAKAIEEAAAKDPDVCFGCHGGRPWYRISYPYPRHAYPAMAKEVPEWAKDRPTESESRYQIQAAK